MSKRNEDFMELAVKVTTAIRNKHGVGNGFIPKEDIEGTLPCPICGKDMIYSISSYNGHRSAECPCFGIYCE